MISSILLGALVVLLNSSSYQDGYNYGINEWNQYASDLTHHFECPLSHTNPHSDFCVGYDSAIVYETSDQ